MTVTVISRVTARAVISAALAAGSLSLTVTAASAHAGPATAINCPPPHPEVTATVSDC